MLLDAGLPRPGGAAELKGAGDYITASDRKSEAAIVEVLARETPGIPVLAEEAGGLRAGTMWARVQAQLEEAASKVPLAVHARSSAAAPDAALLELAVAGARPLIAFRASALRAGR